MLSVSTRWAPTLATDHGIVTQVDVLDGAGSVLLANLPIVDGAVSVDRGSEIRRTLSLSLGAPENFPAVADALLNVYGNQLRVRSGLRYLDGSTELITLGTFVITDVSGDIHLGPLSVSAVGQEIRLQRALFDAAQSTVGFASGRAFITSVMAEFLPGVAFVDTSTLGTATLATKTWDRGTTVWTALREVATACAAEIHCDANGTFRMTDVPTTDTATPVWDVTTGEGGVMVSANVSLSADGVYNRVVAEGENAEDNKPPVSGEAKITAPTDPLRYGGPFGKVTKRVTSSLITSTSGAIAVANAELERAKAPNRSVALETLPNPALDAGDCIRVNYGPVLAPELHIVQSFAIPLSVGGSGFTIQTLSGKEDT
ncbi:DUF5047 domain-containing protein [Streptomyces sp. 6N106]|uniref:DUF5047 domain-containing protein n=1 Tax=Streptomyces sp. 6N106 TaxID=3457418 RepID=UPI003FCF5B02